MLVMNFHSGRSEPVCEPPWLCVVESNTSAAMISEDKDGDGEHCEGQAEEERAHSREHM